MIDPIHAICDQRHRVGQPCPDGRLEGPSGEEWSEPPDDLGAWWSVAVIAIVVALVVAIVLVAEALL